MAVFANPFFAYFTIFAATFSFYELGWSRLLPEPSADTALFFLFTFAAALTLAYMTRRIVRDVAYEPEQMPEWTGPVLGAFAAADLLYTGYIPLIGLFQHTFVYGSFTGVPHVHTLVVTLASAYSAIRFADFLKTRKTTRLMEAAGPLLYFVLVVYRGPFMIVLVAWFFVFVLHARRSLGLKSIIALGFAGLFGLYAFGVMGNLRENNQPDIKENNHFLSDSQKPARIQTPVKKNRYKSDIYNLAQPSDWFIHSVVPDEYLWGYIYLTSPAANFQAAVDNVAPIHNWTAFALGELLPDFVSKRLMTLVGVEPIVPPQVNRGLSVAGVYSKSYMYVGWAGPVILFLWMCLLLTLYLRVTRCSPYQLPCVALACVLVVFSSFINPIAYSAISLQLIWPLILPGKDGWAWLKRASVDLVSPRHVDDLPVPSGVSPIVQGENQSS